MDQCLWRVRKDPPYLDAYFTCISYPGPREPTLGVLNAIAFAHASTIPFENLDVRLGRPIALDSASLVDKLVRQRRSGWAIPQSLRQMFDYPGSSKESPCRGLPW